MKSKIFRIFLIIITALVLVGAPESSYARKRSKAKTTQTTSKSKKSKSKKNKNKSGKSKKSKGKKSKNSKGSSRKRRSAGSTYTPPAAEPALNDSLTLAVNAAVLKWIPENMNPGGLRVNSVKPNHQSRSTRVGLNENFTYVPVTQDFINDLRDVVKRNVPDSIRDYSISLNVGQRSLAYYISKVDKLPEKYRKGKPFVRAADPYVRATKGMENDLIALWHSHGRYYSGGSWAWQRPFLFTTAEDIYTMKYILPYVVPMLENAGAYVFLPRERDTNPHEVIVDNDLNEGGELYSQTDYREVAGSRVWTTGEYDGFIYDLKDFRDTENPFENGSYRQTETIRSGKPSVAAWYADIPEDGEYAVYVSYKTLPNSTTDARYTVNYSGGKREFIVDQTMGGSTWIYLGTFPLEAGYSSTEPVVTLSNMSGSEAGKIVTADAVKIGGGMGNIARSRSRSDVYYDPSTPEAGTPIAQNVSDSQDDQLADDEGDDEGDDEDDDEDDEGDEEEDDTADDDALDDSGKSTLIPADPSIVPGGQSSSGSHRGSAPSFSTSHLPRYVEGARYWLHWAGFPESVYSPFHGSNDYKDDYTCRGHWVNYLSGGSRVNPNAKGLNLPIDLSMALHSDAGKRSDDSYVGTLGIYFTRGGANYTDGTPRTNSRMLTDLLMRQITNDTRQIWEPRWTRRSMWDKSYAEANSPDVPSSLIELMSHQNFGDMRYGLDPNYQFTVGRAIYKAMARFMSERKDRELVIQPLPVKNFSITHKGKGHYKLTWAPTPDPLEPTAMPKKYIIFERTSPNLGFRKIGETNSTSFEVKVNDTDVHSFKILAANDGGVSFPSEVLALRQDSQGKPPVLIVNGFNRVAGPGVINADGKAGFDTENDFGVPYIKEIGFAGHQREMRRSAGDSFGKSNTDYVGKVIAGNTFDFVAEHGMSVAEAGFGFVSASAGAVEAGQVNLDSYKFVDLILGKQKATTVGTGKSGVLYRTFPKALQSKLDSYVKKGGVLFASGQYVVSDLFGTRSDDGDRDFARRVLGVEPAQPEKTRSGRLASSGSRSGLSSRNYNYSNTLNDKIYIVDAPDAVEPVSGENGDVLLSFTDTDLPAAVINRYGKGRSIVMSVPFETILEEESRDQLMREIMKTLGL